MITEDFTGKKTQIILQVILRSVYKKAFPHFTVFTVNMQYFEGQGYYEVAFVWKI